MTSEFINTKQAENSDLVRSLTFPSGRKLLDRHGKLEDTGLTLTKTAFPSGREVYDLIANGGKTVDTPEVELEQKPLILACAVCKKYKNPETNQYDGFVPKGTYGRDFRLSHGYCPDCHAETIKEINQIFNKTAK